MATDTKLSAEPRAERGKGAARKLRALGRVPAVIYGHGEETRTLTVDAHEFDLLRSRVTVENTVIDIKIKGERKAVRALVRELQTHPVKDDVLHVDFYQIHAGEMITVDVPIRLEGQPAGVREGGLMQHTLVSIEVRCSVDAIPESLTLDVSALEIGDSLKVSDLPFPEGVVPQIETERTVCSVIPPTVVAVEEEEEEVLEEAEAAEPELIGREREEDEEEKAEEGD